MPRLVVPLLALASQMGQVDAFGVLPSAAVRGSRALTSQHAMSEEVEELARDPRFAPPWITENHELLQELADESAAAPNPATASKSPHIRQIANLDEFNTAMTSAEATGGSVVVKYYAPWCRSCRAIKHLYDSMANKANGFLAASFYEVDADVAKVLNTHANVKKMPIAQVYGRGPDGGMVLQGTWLIEKKANFDEFAAGLIDLVPLVSTGAAAVEPDAQIETRRRLGRRPKCSSS